MLPRSLIAVVVRNSMMIPVTAGLSALLIQILRAFSSNPARSPIMLMVRLRLLPPPGVIPSKPVDGQWMPLEVLLACTCRLMVETQVVILLPTTFFRSILGLHPLCLPERVRLPLRMRKLTADWRLLLLVSVRCILTDRI